MHRYAFKTSRERFHFGRALSAGGMSLLLLVSQTAPLLGNPTGGTVVAGGATIGPAGSTLTINQSTQNAIINWQQFSIASGETTKFIVPNSGATLNRVTGGNPSAIFGNLQSNGTLYLVNPSGIVVGPTGRIDTAGFLASTLDISNQQFLAGGNLEFAGGSGASVENDGVIHASTGDVYLIANQVDNKGKLSAPHGTVGLAAGSDVLFQQAGSQHLFVQATPAGTQRALGMTNSGTIRAAAAELKAAGGNAYALAINNTGVIAATGYKKINGQVYLTSDGGSISNSGRISARQANGNGGKIVVQGTAVNSKTSGTVANSGTLDASATVAGGQGGAVTVKNMTGTTSFTGTILAKGGPGGAGGAVEVSGNTLQFAGKVDVTAPGGTTGTLLLDPATLTVISGGTGTVSSGQNDATSTSIDPATVESALATANLTLNANTNITISNAIAWSSANTLTLSTNTVGSTIDINAPISGVNGTLVINAASPTDFSGTGSAGAINVASFILQSGSWNQDASSLPAFIASHNFSLEGQSTFTRIEGFDSAHGGALEITDIYGLEGLGSPSGNNLGVPAELVNNIDATSTATWNSGAGFVPIGFYDYSNSGDANTYSGTFNGAGFTINGLTINRPSDIAGVGLFGDTAGAGTLENLSLTNVNVTGSTYVGGLVGVCNATVQDVDVSGSVTGSSYVGGIMGISSGAISNSYSIAKVTGSASTGGLDGYEQFGSINDCYSSGLLASGGGGLVGSGNSAVTNSFWDTTTSGASTSAGGTGDPTATLLMASTYTGVNWNIGTNPGSNTWVILNGQTRPMLGLEFSTTISNAHQLQLIGLNSTTLTENYTLASNIDLSGVTNPADIWGTSTTNGGPGFVPIGYVTDTTENVFTGRLNGEGYAINALYINRSTDDAAGLFAETGSAAQIQNLGLTNAQVTGNFDVGALVGTNAGALSNLSSTGTDVTGVSVEGGLVGYNALGTISNAYSTGTITGATTGTDGGGLVGTSTGTITLSYSTATVNGTNVAGGLAGWNDGGTITQSYSTGNVTGPAAAGQVGGLLGTNGGTLTNAYSTGAVTAGANSTDVGGLVGYNYGTINNAYSTGLVTPGSGTTNVGGLVGDATAGSISDTYFATDGSGQSAGVGTNTGATVSYNGQSSANITGRTLSQLKQAANFDANWNFTTIWTTFGDTTTPQLLGLPSLSGTVDTLSGTAYTDSGATFASGVTIDLVYDGGLIGSPVTTSSTGAFSFSISSNYLTGGVLLTDATDSGNTFYQANTPASTILGIDIYGSTLRVVADTASNAALGLTAGNLTGAGINYAISSGALSTHSGVNLSIFSSYTLDGNITASGALTTAASSTLTSSASSITLSAATMNLGGSLASTGGVTLNSTGAILASGPVSVGSFILENGTWTQIVGQNGLVSLPAFTDPGDFELQNSSTFERFAGGNIGSGNPYQIADVFGLQGLGSPSGNLLAANADLVGTISAATTAGWNGGAGFVPIGFSAPYTATFNGEGNTINGLVINRPNSSAVGLFSVATDLLENVNLTNVQITGGNNVGALAGATGNTIPATITTGIVEDCSSTGTVIGNGSYVGGLVGLDHGTLIVSSYTGGAVSGGGFVGGLTGSEGSQINDDYSTATVSGGGPVGGLVGENYYAGSVLNSYSTGTVTGSSEVGALVGRNYNTVSNSFWDTTTSGITSSTGGIGSGTNSGATPATTAQLESQTFILNNAPTSPTWDFTNVWTTNNGTTLPQLIGLPSSASSDLLSGTVYSDSGATFSAGTLVNLIFDGSLLGSTTTSGTGTFSFTISSTDLTGGVLLTDGTVGGNTFYQANTPAATISGIDIYGSTLRVVADSASNAALGVTAGNLSGAGINYAVTSGALATNSAVNLSVISNYTLDGNVTASGILSTGSGADLTGSANVTVTGSSVALAGTFNRTGSLAVTSTSGDISLVNVGALNTPATTAGMTLTSAGAVSFNNSYLATAGGALSATGTGSATNQNGVDILNSVIDSQGGSISLTGHASYLFSNSQNGNVAGIGVLVDNSIVETASATDSELTGNITINGNGSAGNVQAPVTVVNNLIGVDITHGVMSVVNGAISLTGNVNAGTAAAVLQNGASTELSGSAFGVISNNGNVITAKGTGTITIAGNSSAATAQLSNIGVDLSGLDPNTDAVSDSYLSVINGTGGITVTGTAGTVTNSPVGASVSTPVTSGIVVDYGTNVTAGGAAPITLIGTGGNDLNVSADGLDSEKSLGIFVVGASNSGGGGSPSVIVASGAGNISLTGTAGSSIGTVEGVVVQSSGGNTASISSTSGNISIMGSTPNEGSVIQSLSSTNNGDTAGVNIQGANAGASLSSITATAGSIFIQGLVNSGTDNTREAGVIIHGGATVTASGTGGASGPTAQGDVTIIGDTTGSTAQSLNGGVFIYGANSIVSASGLVPDSHEDTGLSIFGTATTIDGSLAAPPVDGVTIQPLSVGIGMINGATVETLGSAPAYLSGVGGANENSLNGENGYADPTTEATSGSYGVAVFSPLSGQSTSLSAGGNLSINGTAGSSPTSGFGVVVGGSNNSGNASVSSANGNVTISGTGGSGNAEDTGVLSNAGVGVLNPGNIVNNQGGMADVSASNGNISITGTAGAGGLTGVDLYPYFRGNNLDAFGSGLHASGSVSVTSDSGMILSDAGIQASAISFGAPEGTSSPITASSYPFSPVSLSGGDYVFTDHFSPVDFATANVTGLTINESDSTPQETDLGSITTGSLTVTTDGNININGPVNAGGPVTLQNTEGNITFGPNGSITDNGESSVVLAAGTNLANSHYIINNSTAQGGPIQVYGGSFYLYSADPTNDVLGNITVPSSNVVYGATYPASVLPGGNSELFFVSDAGAVGPNAPGAPSGTTTTMPPPSTTTGGASGAGSTIVPPALVPQPTPITPPATTVVTTSASSGNDFLGATPPPFSFTGTGISQLLGQEDGGLANSASNSAQVGTGDAAQLGNGQLNSVNNPQAAGTLNEALGPIVYQNLADALKDIGEWADVPDSTGDTANGSSDSGETILSGGDVAEMTSTGVKNIPLDQAPRQLQKAMNVDGLNGTGAGH